MMSRSSDLYTVKEGDTLSEVARRHGTTVDKLCKINAIANPNRIKAGQLLVLRPDRSSSVTIQLVDRDRNPIPNGNVRLDHAEKSETFTSEVNGRVPAVPISGPGEVVKIFLQRGDGTWKHITEVVSGLGDKLVTMISPKIKLVSRTMPHPGESSRNPVHGSQHPRERMMPSEHPQTTVARGKTQGDYGDGKGPKTVEGTSATGLPTVTVTNDQAELDFLKGYTGEKITKEDYRKAAETIGCEVAVIKAVATIEGKAGFDKKNRPIILYERHVFSRNTSPQGKYDNPNPDISSVKRYKSRSKKMKDDGKNASEFYGNSYRRLAKAYSLDKAAALKACSWGKFQILGENYMLAGFSNVEKFVSAMCKSEKEHLKAFVNFINSQRLLRSAARTKNWDLFAAKYNGTQYKDSNYDIKLKEAYYAHLKKGA